MKALVDRVCFAVVDDDCVELAQFMAVAENIFFHGYKGMRERWFRKRFQSNLQLFREDDEASKSSLVVSSFFLVDVCQARKATASF